MEWERLRGCPAKPYYTGHVRIAFALLFAAVLWAEGTNPKDKPEEYRASAKLEGRTIAADYLTRTFFGDVQGKGQGFWTQDYLVVEVSVYSPSRDPQTIHAGSFTLRLNGKKQTLLPQSSNFVAASLRYPDWRMRPTLQAGGGIGDAGVRVGGPPVTGRFPGDPRPSQRRLPNPPQAPQAGSPVEQEPLKTADQAALERALPEGERVPPVSGYLYFPYTGKVKKIKTLELLYQGPGGSATLKLK